MKGIKTLLLMMTVTIQISTFAQQTFSPREIIGLSMCKTAKFENYVLNKGYSYAESTVDDGYTTKTYRSDRKYENGDRDQISRVADIYILYLTRNKKYYLNFQDSLTQAGFKLSKTEEDTTIHATVYYYKQWGYTFKISTFFSKQDARISYYSIALSEIGK